MEFDELLEHLDDLIDLVSAEDFRLFAAALARLRRRADEIPHIYSHRGPMTERIAEAINRDVSLGPLRRHARAR